MTETKNDIGKTSDAKNTKLSGFNQMKLTLLDTKTGKTKEIDSRFNDWWWAEGNGSCDCNRVNEFGFAEKFEKEYRKENPKLYNPRKPWQKCCFGCKRFLIIKTDSIEYTIKEFNSDYPSELVDKYYSK